MFHVATHRAVAVAACALLLLSVTGAAQEQATHVQQVQHRAATELLPLAVGAMGDRGQAVLDDGTNSIVLVGEPEAVEQTRRLLAQQDRARRTVLVYAEARRLSGLDSAGYTVEWRPDRSRMRVGDVAWPSATAAERGVGREIRSRPDAVQSNAVRILEGEVGVVETGRGVPVRQRGIFGGTTLIEARSGLLAQPRVLADGRVQMRVRQFRGDIDPAARVGFGSADTTVTLTPGETVAIAEARQKGREASARVFSTTEPREARDDVVVLVRVEVE